jgi:hypothetical protein
MIFDLSELCLSPSGEGRNSYFSSEHTVGDVFILLAIVWIIMAAGREDAHLHVGFEPLSGLVFVTHIGLHKVLALSEDRDPHWIRVV